MNLVTCTECDRTISAAANSGNYEWASGAVKLRSRGNNQLALPRRTGRYVCRDCVDQLTAGFIPGQQSLLEDPE